MPADRVVPFGIRVDDDGNRETVFLEDISHTEEEVANNFGRRCGLICPECGKPLIARRRGGDNKHGFKCFAHESGAGAHCGGYGEKSSHKAAEDMLANGIGQIFYLPAITASDMIPHTSQYKDNGDTRYTVHEMDDVRRQIAIETCNLVNDEMILQPQMACAVEKVWIENDTKNAPISLPENKRPDAVVQMYNRKNINEKYVIAVEFRYKHAKSLDDMQAFYESRTDVLEILLPDLSDMNDNFKRSLHDTIFGINGADNDSNKYVGKREWLYSHTALSLLMHKYTLAVQPYVYIKNDNGYQLKRLWDSTKKRACAIVDSYVNNAFSDSGVIILKSKYTNSVSWSYTFQVPYFPFDDSVLYARLEYTLGIRNDDESSSIQNLESKANDCICILMSQANSDNAKREEYYEKKVQERRIKAQQKAERERAIIAEEEKRQAAIHEENRKRREQIEEARIAAYKRQIEYEEEQRAQEEKKNADARNARAKTADEAISNMTFDQVQAAFMQAIARLDALHIRPVIVADVLKREKIDSNSLFGYDTQEYDNVAPYLSKIAIDTFNRTSNSEQQITKDIILRKSKNVSCSDKLNVIMVTLTMSDSSNHRHSVAIGVPSMSNAEAYKSEYERIKRHTAIVEISRDTLWHAFNRAKEEYTNYGLYSTYNEKLIISLRQVITEAIEHRGNWSYLR